MKKTILIIEDEKDISDLIKLYLTNDGFNIIQAFNGTDGLKKIKTQEIDLILLDIMLPDMDGFEVCNKIRQKYTQPIIMLTAKDSEIDKIQGLTLGADDYMNKPFRPLELIARIKAQLRRASTYNLNDKISSSSIITVKGLLIDYDHHICTLNEKPLILTPTEFEILWQLCKSKGKVLSSKELFEKIWNEPYQEKTNNIMVHIRNLREKMNDSFESPKYIKTVWGVGYKIEE